jgi:hypothetical protein
VNLDQSIELDILEDAVEDSPDTLWNILEFFRHHYPDLDYPERLQAAKRLVHGMVDKGWVRVIDATPESRKHWGDYPTVRPEREWEIGSEPELRKFLVVATPLGEEVYLGRRSD